MSCVSRSGEETGAEDGVRKLEMTEEEKQEMKERVRRELGECEEEEQY